MGRRYRKKAMVRFIQNCEDSILKLDLDTISDIRWLASQAQAWPVYKDNFIDWVSLDSANFSC